ncbi:MAG TPA: flavoprotein, partial [Methanothrix sp.]|nr:flavoprotein [Methanothrix sp.]
MSSSISCTVSDSLSGKVIVLAVTGSIAAVRTIDLARALIRRGAAVHPVMSGAAT